MESGAPRYGLFAVVSVGLVALGVWFAGGEEPSREPGPGAAVPAALRPPASALAVQRELSRAAAAARRVGRRFVRAYARFEVGEWPEVEAELRATATEEFVAELGEWRGVADAGAYVPAGSIATLRVSFLDGEGTRVLLSGDLHRGAVLEQFGFVMELRDGRWVVVGAGQ